MPTGDIHDLLDANGWHALDDTAKRWRKGNIEIEVTEALIELMDFSYMRGCRWGVARGMYEQQVQEDVEAGDVQQTIQTEEKCPKCLLSYTEGLGGC